MSADFWILLIQAWVIGLIILLVLLLFLLMFAVAASLLSIPNNDVTHAAIRHIGAEARGEIRKTAESYQKQAEDILTHRR